MEYGSLYDLLRNDTMYLTGDMILQITRDVSVLDAFLWMLSSFSIEL
jgi:hypothetical protein